MLQRWSDSDFEALSWHDNHIHGFSLREGKHGSGDLLLDIDYILEWLCDAVTGACQFRLAPATLTFHEVSDLAVKLDYAEPTAALGPASIGQIERRLHTYPNGSQSWRWHIAVNWPAGSISFLGQGFTQVLRATPVLSSQQYLHPTEREALLR